MDTASLCVEVEECCAFFYQTKSCPFLSFPYGHIRNLKFYGGVGRLYEGGGRIRPKNLIS